MQARVTRNQRILLATFSVYAFIGAGQIAFATDYYVSPTGSDSGDGSLAHPWATLAKVDAMTFAPGDNIDFQRGGVWHENLTATSSGTTSAPITYGAYGTGADPTFTGADAVTGTWQSLGAGTAAYSTAYTMPAVTNPGTNKLETSPNAIVTGTQFTHNATMLTNSTDAATNIAYVQNNVNTSYYDPTAQKLYVNTGVNPASSSISAALRQEIVNTNLKSNITVQNINVTFAAGADFGYSFWANSGSNIKFINDTSYGAGKHDFADIESQNFVGSGLKASYSLPDQGNGGSTAFVAYADPTHIQNINSTWVNDTATNANGPYPSYYSHGSIGTTVITNLVTDRSLDLDSNTTFTGGTLNNTSMLIYGTGSVVSGVKVTGANGSIGLAAGSSGNTIQNSLVAGAVPNYWAGHNGAINDAGTDNIIRFNTLDLDPTATNGAAIGLLTGNSGDSIYGNIVDAKWAIQLFGTESGLSMNHNLFYNGSTLTSPTFFMSDRSSETLAQWQSMGYDVNSLLGDPKFIDAADSDYELGAGSLAIDAFLASFTPDQLPLTDLDGMARPADGLSFGAFEVPEPTSALVLGSGGLLLMLRRKRA